MLEKDKACSEINKMNDSITICNEQYDNFIHFIGESFSQIQDIAYQQYKPIAIDLCGHVADEEEVAYHLDRIVSFCGTENVLALFKMICRKYLYLYPELIAFEIQTYKEMFDDGSSLKRNTGRERNDGREF